MAEPVDLVLFDLGGVLIEIPGVHAMLELTGIHSEEELWRRWLTCRWVRRFESGDCSEAEFAAGGGADWQLELSAAVFLEAFRDLPAGPLARARGTGCADPGERRHGLLQQHQCAALARSHRYMAADGPV